MLKVILILLPASYKEFRPHLFHSWRVSPPEPVSLMGMLFAVPSSNRLLDVLFLILILILCSVSLTFYLVSPQKPSNSVFQPVPRMFMKNSSSPVTTENGSASKPSG